LRTSTPTPQGGSATPGLAGDIDKLSLSRTKASTPQEGSITLGLLAVPRDEQRREAMPYLRLWVD